MSGKFKQIPYNLDIGSKQTVRRNTADDSFEVVEIYSKGETDTQLSNKVDKETGKGLSANDYTTTDKNKLDSIEEGAEVNITENVNAGTNITIDRVGKDITINSTGGGGGSGGVTDHNSLTGIQGGTVGDYQHLNTAQVTKLNNQSGTNTGDQTINTGIITATAGQTVVTVGTHIVNSSKLTILVNGLEQTLGTDYTDTSTTSITFTSGLIVNDEVKYKILS